MQSPKANANGARNQFYDNITETRPGDVVLTFKYTYVKAVGIVVGRAETVTKPTEFNSGENQWDRMDGLYLFGLLTWSGQYARRITWNTLGQISLRLNGDDDQFVSLTRYAFPTPYAD